MKVMFTGSRSLKTLPDEVIRDLRECAIKNYEVIVGDDDGVCASVIDWFHGRHRKVSVFFDGFRPRNNRSFSTHNVSGNEFDKDRMMRFYCDCAVVVWNGVDKRMKYTIDELRRRGKEVKEYIVPGKESWSSTQSRSDCDSRMLQSGMDITKNEHFVEKPQKKECCPNCLNLVPITENNICSVCGTVLTKCKTCRHSRICNGKDCIKEEKKKNFQVPPD